MSIPQCRSDSASLIAQVDSIQDETTGDFYYRTFAPGVGMAHCGGVHVVNLIYYHQSNNMLLIKRLAHYCDALQFSSPELKRKYGYLNLSVAFFQIRY